MFFVLHRLDSTVPRLHLDLIALLRLPKTFVALRLRLMTLFNSSKKL